MTLTSNSLRPAAIGQRPNPRFGEITYRENAGRSMYDALQLSLNQRPWQGLTFDAYYTYGRSIGYYGPDGTLTTDGSVQNPDDIAGSGDVFYVFGGCSLAPDRASHPSRTYLRDAWRFSAGTWTRLADLPTALAAAGSPAPVFDHSVYVISGDEGTQIGLPSPADHAE